MTDYAALYATKASASSVASDVKRIGELLSKYGPWIDRYRGGLPRTWMAMMMLWESNGKADLVGDSSLGEYGLYQIASYVPPLFGLPASARLDPESNVAIAALELSMEAIKWFLRYPDLVVLGSPDSWKLARLSFAVGRGGSYQLAALAKPTQRGEVFTAIRNYVAANGGVPLGSQTANKVWFRVMNIELQWQIAAKAAGGSMSSGPPQLPPHPPAGAYSVAADIAGHFTKPIPTLLIAAAGAVGALVYLRTRRR